MGNRKEGMRDIKKGMRDRKEGCGTGNEGRGTGKGYGGYETKDETRNEECKAGNEGWGLEMRMRRKYKLGKCEVMITYDGDGNLGNKENKQMSAEGDRQNYE
jgi:hypothetical protein